MGDNEVLKTRIAPQLKLQAKAIADREFLSEAAWLKRLVVREIRSIHGAGMAEQEPCRPARSRHPAPVVQVRVRADPTRHQLQDLQSLALHEEAVRLAKAAPALVQQAQGTLIRRNLNQIAKAANDGGRVPSSAREELRAMLRVCEALRDNMKALLMANLTSWESGHGEDV